MLSLEQRMLGNAHFDNALESSSLRPNCDIFFTCGQEKGCEYDHDHVFSCNQTFLSTKIDFFKGEQLNQFLIIIMLLLHSTFTRIMMLIRALKFSS